MLLSQYKISRSPHRLQEPDALKCPILNVFFCGSGLILKAESPGDLIVGTASQRRFVGFHFAEPAAFRETFRPIFRLQSALMTNRAERGCGYQH
ncbi:MAG: hypothetical protein B6D36_03655 [Planctomycetes bacterium UTPLA1]|nr:MAG: hypothetical protein B6D36_03655 [Planctomycetes bacterium UTPLA1]